MAQIYLADWTFYFKLNSLERERGIKQKTYVVKDVVTKKIPLRFILNDMDSYHRATRGMLSTFMHTLQDDRNTGIKKFTIKYTKKIGDSNE